MIRCMTILAAAPLFLGAACERGGGPDAAAAHLEDSVPAAQLPRFTPEGRLLRPEGWEGWVLAGTSMGLTYNEPAAAPAPGEPLMVTTWPSGIARFLALRDFLVRDQQGVEVARGTSGHALDSSAIVWVSGWSRPASRRMEKGTSAGPIRADRQGHAGRP